MKILTFVIATRNRHNYLSKIIHEIKDLDIQIIVIDDNSDCKNKIKNIKLFLHLKNLKYIYLNKNLGQPYASNLGIKLCRTRYIWFFDDDDFVKKIDVIKIISYLKNSDIKCLLLTMVPIFQNRVLKKIYPNLKEHNFISLRKSRQKINTSCSIFNIKSIKKIGGWDQSLVSGKDTDLFLRFANKNKFSIKKDVEIFVNYSSKFRTTNNILIQLKGKIQFLKKHWKILTIKRIIVIFLTFILIFPLFNNIKQKLKIYFLNKI